MAVLRCHAIEDDLSLSLSIKWATRMVDGPAHLNLWMGPVRYFFHFKILFFNIYRNIVPA